MTASTVGPIQVSENGRYFVDQNGDPFFWLGDTHWELFRRFTLEEAEMILEDRAEKGFNAIQVMITGVGDGTMPDLSGQKPWLNDDPGTPNEAYFKNVDEVLQLRKNLIFVLGVFHQLQIPYITPANARMYARWIAERYKDLPNIIWTTYPRAEQESVPVLRELAAGLQEGDEGKHIITVHPDPSPASSSFIHSESWMACNMIQTWAHYDRICEMVTNDYNLTPTKPALMVEGAYEAGIEYGFPVTPLMVRRQAYWSCLAGGYHSYGHNDIWRVLPTWKSALDAPGASQMDVLRKVFTGLQWWNLVPDQSILADQSSENLGTAARSSCGDWVMVYLSEAVPVSIDVSKITASSEVEASWVNPVTGIQTRIDIFQNMGTRSFSPPAEWEDAVLLLLAAGND